MKEEHAATYCTEVCYLCEAVQGRFHELQQMAARWLELYAAAEQAYGADDDRAHDEASDGAVEAMARMHLHLEAFLSFWARLSLLFHPSKMGVTAFTLARAKYLRELFDAHESVPLKDRGLRDAWAHMDVRMDQACGGDRLGSVVRFVHSVKVVAAMQHSVFVLDVEQLCVHFRKPEGDEMQVRLADLTAVAKDFHQRQDAALRRLVTPSA